MPITESDIENFFTYHAPTQEKLIRFDNIRTAAIEFGKTLVANTKPSADQSAALRHLREACFTANASIALEPDSL